MDKLFVRFAFHHHGFISAILLQLFAYSTGMYRSSIEPYLRRFIWRVCPTRWFLSTNSRWKCKRQIDFPARASDKGTVYKSRNFTSYLAQLFPYCLLMKLLQNVFFDWKNEYCRYHEYSTIVFAVIIKVPLLNFLANFYVK